MPSGVEPSTTRQTGTRSVHANRGEKPEEEKDRVGGEHEAIGGAVISHRATGAAEDAVGTDGKFGIRKEDIFLKPPCLHNPMFGLSSSLSRVRYAAHKTARPGQLRATDASHPVMKARGRKNAEMRTGPRFETSARFFGIVFP